MVAYTVAEGSPVEVFIETSLVILSDGASQNLRKFIWGNLHLKYGNISCNGAVLIFVISDDKEKKLTYSFSIVECTWEKYNGHLMTAVLLL